MIIVCTEIARIIVPHMKTPQRWRTFRIYVIVVFAILTLFDVMTSFCDVTWRHDVIVWRHTTSWCHSKGQSNVSCHKRQEKAVKLTGNHIFQPGDLDLWPWPTNSSEILSRSIRTNFGVNTSNGLTVRALTNWQTDGKTDGKTHRNTGPILLPRPLTQEVKIYVSEMTAVLSIIAGTGSMEPVIGDW